MSVDAFGNVTAGASSSTTVDVTMKAAQASISGRVTQTTQGGGAVPAGNVQVTVSSGSQQRVVYTASEANGSVAVGDYVVDGLDPGTYTVTFTRSGTRANSKIVVLTAAQQLDLPMLLEAPAGIEVTVRHAGGGSVAGLAVLLYRASEYGTAAQPVLVGTTDASGAYDFVDVDAPENYIVEVRTTVDGAVLATSEPITLKASQIASLPITITDDD